MQALREQTDTSGQWQSAVGKVAKLQIRQAFVHLSKLATKVGQPGQNDVHQGVQLVAATSDAQMPYGIGLSQLVIRSCLKGNAQLPCASGIHAIVL